MTGQTENKFELIISTESKVLACNIRDFEAQANQYLSTLTSTFETDDDFARAKEEVKELKEIESKIRTAIKNTTNGEIAALIATAEAIAERFRSERLSREKLVDSKEKEIKQSIISQSFDRILKIKCGYENDISLAIEKNISKQSVQNRLNEAAKRRSTISTLTKAINAEETAITAEIGAEAARISARRKLIPAHYEHLFKDWLVLIAGDEELEPIIQQRIAEEEKREAEIKAKAEQEAKAKAEAEKVQVEAKAIVSEMDAQGAVKAPENLTALSDEASDEPVFKFEVRIGFTATQSWAVDFARQIKAKYGLENNVSLKKMN